MLSYISLFWVLGWSIDSQPPKNSAIHTASLWAIFLSLPAVVLFYWVLILVSILTNANPAIDLMINCVQNGTTPICHVTLSKRLNLLLCYIRCHPEEYIFNIFISYHIGSVTLVIGSFCLFVCFVLFFNFIFFY